ncbi:hypothetical protein EKO23_15250 [Nocardioides guangzhouensis]|uniref:Uncharacterized protein n=1 Tax=Nocardioides guangzhouensis TaxID=2497878 RepID=A0A4Q4ZAH1_9ACTN|nr:hypothetical protein [Nocardioides guangzhouensis]RYP84618.1 hypothetical protein EKO23_15250 [Nocardioides guangzhouensis]
MTTPDLRWRFRARILGLADDPPIRRLPGFTYAGLAAVAALISGARPDLTSVPAVDRVCEFTGLSPAEVRRSLAWVETVGLVERIGVDGHCTDLWRLLLAPQSETHRKENRHDHTED